MTGRARRGTSTTQAGGALRRSAGFVALASAFASAFAIPLLAPTVLSAQQVRSSVVLGGVRVRYADALDVDAITASPAVTLQSGLSLLGANATVSQPMLGTWSAQGALSGSFFRPVNRVLSAELAANTGGSASGDGTRTGNAHAMARAHLAAARAGAWLGAGGGFAWNGFAWQGTRATEFGAWLQGDATSAVASWSPIVANDSVRYVDAVLALRWRGSRVELDGTLGHRSGTARPSGLADLRGWASMSASLRFSDRVAIVAGGGSYPLDLLQGFPSGRFVSLGIRFTGPGSGPSPEFARNVDEVGRERLVRAGITALRVRRTGTDRYEIRMRASGANRIEVSGDITGWESTAMRAEPDGWWSLVVEAGAGISELTVRRDGGPWLVPPGLVERRDEFGGVSGVITLLARR